MESGKTVLALDPGFSKIGMALVRRTGPKDVELLWRCIAPPDELSSRLDQCRAVAAYSLILVGSGTRSKELVAQVRELEPGMGLLVVDEKNTTQAARERYWEHHPRRWWQRLMPASLSVPSEDVDDFAALVLAERVLLD